MLVKLHQQVQAEAHPSFPELNPTFRHWQHFRHSLTHAGLANKQAPVLLQRQTSRLRLCDTHAILITEFHIGTMESWEAMFCMPPGGWDLLYDRCACNFQRYASLQVLN